MYIYIALRMTELLVEMKRLVLCCEERTRQIDQLKSESENKGIQIQVYVPQWVN